jgi:hypothetical protein
MRVLALNMVVTRISMSLTVYVSFFLKNENNLIVLYPFPISVNAGLLESFPPSELFAAVT